VEVAVAVELQVLTPVKLTELVRQVEAALVELVAEPSVE
jgi:hypothetical protein